MNQLTLGEATNSPDATSVPVRFALALLQDKDGVILLDVPVEGKLDDPEFRLGKVIWRAVLNVLVKVATSPFRALAALAGGGDADLSVVEFVPGTADPLPAARERIAMLAKSLAQRPALVLDLEGSADAEQDGAALRRAALERSLRHAKAATLRPPPASIEELELAPDERVRLVRAAYEAGFPTPAVAPRKPGDAPPPPPTPAQMEERLAAASAVPPEAFRALAAERDHGAGGALEEDVDAEARHAGERIRQVRGAGLLELGGRHRIARHQVFRDLPGLLRRQHLEAAKRQRHEFALGLHLRRAAWREDEVAHRRALLEHRGDQLIGRHCGESVVQLAHGVCRSSAVD